MHRTYAAILAVATVFASQLVCAQDITIEVLPRVESPHPDWLGASGCSARACHGNPGPGRSHPLVLGNEHTIWHQFDKHRQAYAVLCQPLGQAIAQRLGLPPAHQAKQCLVCHAPAATEVAGASTACPPSVITEGVGCESCHGKAGKWIVAHTTADWGVLSPFEKEHEFGLTDTKNLISRARLCATCHVGAAGGEVNHDLIAAGHPRLRFEFASHLARLPLHWDEKGENDRRLQPAFEARAWSIGQVVTAQSQLNLIGQRRDDTVWPEFADFSCYACHRDLDATTGKASKPVADLGRPAFSPWHVSMLPLLGLENAPKIPWHTDRGATARMAQEAAKQLQPMIALADSADYDPQQLRLRLTEIVQRGPDLIGDDWDKASQLYLAISAWQQARIDSQQGSTRRDLSMAQLLRQSRKELLEKPHTSDSARRFKESVPRLGQEL